jgi:hypothetical protein
MSSTYISAELRRSVATRAGWLCEYCLIHEDDTYFGCEVDHIISEKHGGLTVPENLAYACAFCNRSKGSDIGSITSAGEFSRFFNPRIDLWVTHFRLEGLVIVPATDVGEVTVRLLQLNDEERILERRILHQISRYPSIQALKHIGG